jgi:hypothetical protein
MNEVQEKDNFWLIVAGVVVAAVATMVMVKSSEHDKYASTAKAIAEDSSNSAYPVKN